MNNGVTPRCLIDDLRNRINPAYSAQLGTESYERRLCAEALEAQAEEIERLTRSLDGVHAMMRQRDLREVRLDVERMRKAASRLDELEEAYACAISRLAFAEQGLKIIATTCELPHIVERARDTLRLMGIR